MGHAIREHTKITDCSMPIRQPELVSGSIPEIARFLIEMDAETSSA
jgi:hypothetical protein